MADRVPATAPQSGGGISSLRLLADALKRYPNGDEEQPQMKSNRLWFALPSLILLIYGQTHREGV